MSESERLELVQALVPSRLVDKVLAARHQIEGERKQVTALFADVEGSTALAAQLDPEDVLEIMNGFFHRMAEAVHTYEGMVDSFLGDGILALFGAPLMHEDDPRRSVLAALDMQRSCREHARQVENRFGVSPQVRVGLNTGTVVVGTVGSDLHMEYTAMGDAVNLAQRMESACPPGSVLISDTTHHLVGPFFETRPVGPLQLKGIADPVEAHEVIAVRPGVSSARGLEGLSSPLVGREPELAALGAVLDELRAGRGVVTAIVGEAGLGKTRLISEFAARAQAGDVQCSVGHALSYGNIIGYHLARDALRGVLAVDATTPPGEVEEKLRAELESAQLGDGPYDLLAAFLELPLDHQTAERLEQLDAEVQRKQTHQVLCEFLEARTLLSPIVLIWEDLHWSDPSSLGMLDDLLAVTSVAPLALVLTLRPSIDTEGWSFHADQVKRRPSSYRTLELEALTDEETRSLIQNLLEIEDLSDQARGLILTKAEGNPFFVEEILRDMIDRGAIERLNGTWHVTEELDHVAVPDTLEGVIGARVDRLPPDAKGVLQIASVIGRTFDAPVLSAVTEADGKHAGVLAALAELGGRQLVVPEGAHDRYTFKHALVNDAAYEGLLRSRRRSLHRLAGETLEALFPERTEELASVLARHFELAEEVDRAAYYLGMAARRAAAVYSNQEALEFLSRALLLTEDPRERFELLAARSTLHALLAQREQQKADTDALMALAEELGDDALRTEALRHTIHYFLATDYLSAEEHLVRALDLVENTGLRVPKALLLRQQAEFHRFQYADPKAVRALEEAAAIFEAEGLEHELAKTLPPLAYAYSGAEDVDRAKETAERAVGVARRLGDPLVEAQALRFAVGALLDAEDYEMAAAFAERALKAARQAGDKQLQISVVNSLGWIHRHLSDPDTSEELFLDGLERSTGLGFEIGWLSSAMGLMEMWEALGWYQHMYDWLTAALAEAEGQAPPHQISYLRYALGYRCLRWLGQFEEALEHVTQAYGMTEQDTWQPPRVMYRNGQATLMNHLGRRDEAWELISEARQIAEAHEMTTTYPYLYSTQANIRLGLGDRKGARHYAEELLEVGQRAAWVGERQEALTLLAQLDLVQEDVSEALPRSQEAVQMLKKAPMMEVKVAPQEVYYVRAQVLGAAKREDEMTEALGQAHTAVQERAAAITAARLRESFLTQVPVNREVMVAWQTRSD